MVCEWGMSSLGMISFAEGGEHVFLARDISRPREYSEHTAQQIDTEVKRIIDEAYERARVLLEERRQAVEILAKALLEYETLSGDEIRDLIAGKPPLRDLSDDPPNRSAPVVPTAGKGRPRQEPDAGMEPQPQA
jgi:cell division protease FtsH